MQRLWLCFWILCCVAKLGFGQQTPALISTGTRSGLRLFAPNSNDWWFDPLAGRLDFKVNGGVSPLATLTSLGNLGIGTTSPATKLELLVASGDGLQITNSSSGNKRWSFSASGNDLQMNEVGVLNRLTLQAGGNVGIGTAGPAAHLHLYGSGTTLRIDDIGNNYNDGDAQNVLAFQGRYWSGDNNLGAVISYIKSHKGGANGFGGSHLSFWTTTVNTSAVAERMRITSGGNVGIGTTTPGAKLDVQGTIQALTTFQSLSGNDLRLNADGANRDIFLQVNGATLAALRGSTGRVGIADLSPAAKLTVGQASNTAAEGLALKSSAGNYWYLYNNTASEDFALQRNNGSPFVSVSATSGNVGVGTTDPVYAKLNVVTAGNRAAYFEGPSGGNGILIRAGSGDLQNAMLVQDASGATTFLIVRSDNRVGVGTVSPGTALDVNGTIRQSTVKSCANGVTTDSNGGFVGCAAGGSPAVPTRTVITASGCTPSGNCSGGATYATPANTRQIRIRMVAGGGGGGATYNGGTTGLNGGASSFGSVTANGGIGGGAYGSNATGGVGGSGGTGTASLRIGGGAGVSWVNTFGGGAGGSSALGGGGPGGVSTNPGLAGAVNSGGGGGGASGGGSGASGSGGGAGEYVELIINTPAASYTYTIGAGGAGGTGGSAGGGAGAAGIIIVDEIY